MQSPNLLLDEGCGSRYCCWFFMLLKPILLNVSIYSERPVKGVSHTENNSGTINTFSPYFSRGRGYIKKNEGTFENIWYLGKKWSFLLAGYVVFRWPYIEISLDLCNPLLSRWLPPETVNSKPNRPQLSAVCTLWWAILKFIFHRNELSELNLVSVHSIIPYLFSRNPFYKHSSSSHPSNCSYRLA